MQLTVWSRRCLAMRPLISGASFAGLRPAWVTAPRVVSCHVGLHLCTHRVAIWFITVSVSGARIAAGTQIVVGFIL